MGTIIGSASGGPLTTVTTEQAFPNAAGNRLILTPSAGGAFDGKLVKLRICYAAKSAAGATCSINLRYHSGTNATSRTVFTNDTSLLDVTNNPLTISTTYAGGMIQCEFSVSHAIISNNYFAIGMYKHLKQTVADVDKSWCTSNNAATLVLGPVAATALPMAFICTLTANTGTVNDAILTEFVMEQP